ncbi:MAG: 3-dehydroquinate synthase family protein [Acidimicrobiales bacterium]
MNVRVELGERSYDVALRAGARHDLADLVGARVPRARAAAIITTATVAAQPWFDLATGVPEHRITVPEGEAAKTPAILAAVVEQLAGQGLSRDDVVVGVGGGATTDLAGFAAAVYLRGVALVQVPTTLVGQVDAAIGGKTGVNLLAGKNLMGAIHQPVGVLGDTDTLATLPERERRSGFAEIAKCWLLEGRASAALAAASLEEMAGVAVALKARVVGADERDAGARALLNYGHTLAHALETYWLARDADRIRHGEAVAVGVAFAARLARSLGLVGDDVVAEHDAALDALGLSRQWPADTDAAAIMTLMGRDKKTHHDLTFVLAGPTGFAVVAGVDPAMVRAALEQFEGER